MGRGLRSCLLLAVLTLGIATPAEAYLFSYGGETIVTAVDLPDSEEFYSEKHRSHMDVGYVYKQFSLIGIPLWNYDGRYCLSLPANPEAYISIPASELDDLLGEIGESLPSSPPIPGWESWGGKLLVLTLVGGLLLFGHLNPEGAERLAHAMQHGDVSLGKYVGYAVYGFLALIAVGVGYTFFLR